MLKMKNKSLKNIKKLNNKAFTLTEMIIVIAISGIFLIFLATITTSATNILSNSTTTYNSFSDVYLLETNIVSFVDAANSNGGAIVVSNQSISCEKNGKRITINNNVIENYNNDTLSLKTTLKDSTISFRSISNHLLIVEYKNNNKTVKTSKYFIVGGCSNA